MADLHVYIDSDGTASIYLQPDPEALDLAMIAVHIGDDLSATLVKGHDHLRSRVLVQGLPLRAAFLAHCADTVYRPDMTDHQVAAKADSLSAALLRCLERRRA